MPTPKNARDNRAQARRARMARTQVARVPLHEAPAQTQKTANEVCVFVKPKRDGKRRGSATANKSADAMARL